MRCPFLQMDPRQRPRLLEVIQNLRERIREARANGWLGQVEGLLVSFDTAMAKLSSLKRAPTDGGPDPVDLGMPVFTDHAPLLQPGSGEPRYRLWSCHRASSAWRRLRNTSVVVHPRSVA